MRLQALEETKMNQVRIITELEKEKKKMQDDVQKLKDAKVRLHISIVCLWYLIPSSIIIAHINSKWLFHKCFVSSWVKPPVSGHPWGQKKCPFKRGVCLWEVKNVVFVCSWENDQVSAYERCPPTRGVRLREVSAYEKCPPTRGVRLREVSVSGVSTVFVATFLFYFLSKTARRWERSLGCLLTTLEGRTPWQVSSQSLSFSNGATWSRYFGGA